MNILLTMRKETFRSEGIASFLIHCQGIQILSLALLPLLDPLSLTIAEFVLLFVQNENIDYSFQILINFILNIVFVLLVILSTALKKGTLSEQISKLGSLIIGAFKYILLVPVLSMNIKFLMNETAPHLRIFSAYNVAFTIFLSFFSLYANWSNRFEQRDFCNKRENSFFSQILLLALIIAESILNSFAVSIFLISYALLSIYQITTYVEFSFIQRNTVFYCFLNIYTAVMLASEQQIPCEVLAYNMILGCFVLKYSTNKICNFLDYRQYAFKNIFNYKFSMSDSFGNEAGEDSEQKNNNGKKDLFLLSRIFFSRKKKKEQENAIDKKSQEYMLWYKEYNEIMLYHLATCTFTDCICRAKVGDWEHQVMVNQMTSLMSKHLKENQKGVSLKITSIYLFVEIAQKPLKAYYQIMRLKREKNTVADYVDLQCLIQETRECFDQIFLKNNVQNSNLALLKVIEFEDIIQSLEIEVRSTLEMNINFLELFMLNSVKVQQVISESDKIFVIKEKINKSLEHLVQEYPDNPRVQMLIFIFYQFVQVYRSREKEFKIFNQEKLIKKRIFDKTDDDIFKPEYGVIYIDLIEERGKIKKITKNLCKIFGYNVEDMIAYNINQFMPRLYGKHHAKFLANFIDNGAIKILKEKRRFLFGKNKSKFIFPVQARLKTEHLFDKQFGATGLIKAIETNSAYIIVGTNGKIEQISQNIYQKLFQPILKNEVDKIRRFCIFKFIPDFIKIINDDNYDNFSQRIHESVAIFSHHPQTFLQKFKINKDGKNGGNDMETSRSASYSDCQYSTIGDLYSKSFDFSQQFCVQIMKSFLAEVNFMRLVLMTIQFKVSKLKTNEFQLVLLQIVNFGQIQHNTAEIIGHYKRLAYYLGIYDDQSHIQQNFSRFADVIETNDVVNFAFNTKSREGTQDYDKDHRNKGKRTLKIIKGQNELDEKSSLIKDNFSQSINMFNEAQNKINQQMRGTSERSSVTDATQHQSKKQMLINAFNSNSVSISLHMGCCLAFVAVKLTVMIVLITCTLQGIAGMQKYLVSQNLSLNISQIYEYRLAMTEIQQFYISMMDDTVVNQTTLARLQDSKSALTQLFTNKIKKIDDETHFLNYSALSLQMVDTLTDQQSQVTLISLFDRLEFTFQHQYNPQNLLDLRVNYQAIHNRFTILFADNHRIYQEKANEYQKLELGLFIVYQAIVISISFVALYAYSHYQRMQKRITDLLRTMNTRQIRKAKLKLKILWDNFKLTKISNLSNVITTLQHDVDSCLDHQSEQATTRNIKLIYQGSKQQLSSGTMVTLIAVFVLIFSGVSIVMYASLMTNSALYFQTTDTLKTSYILQQKVPLFVNLYLTNLNHIDQGEPLQAFGKQIYQDAKDQFFTLTQYISELASIKTISQMGQGIWADVCKLVSCTQEQSQQDLKLSYHILDLKNKFDILSPNENTIDSISHEQMHKWVNENGVIQALGWVPVLFQFSQKWNNILKDGTLSDLNGSQKNLIIISGILLPLYALLMGFIIYKMGRKLNGIIISAEHIHMNFPVSVLSENTYLTSYFNDKIKNNK